MKGWRKEGGWEVAAEEKGWGEGGEIGNKERMEKVGGDGG